MEHFIDTYLFELKKVRDSKTVKKKEYLLKHLINYSDNLPVFDQSEIFSFYEYLKPQGHYNQGRFQGNKAFLRMVAGSGIEFKV